MTTAMETILLGVAPGQEWERKGSSHWLEPESLDVRKMAAVMGQLRGRLITITATQLPDDGGMTMDYHWDLDGQLMTFALKVENNQVPSIFDLCEAADWVEREIHEYLAIEFTGRDYEPLMLRTGDTAGVNLREED